MFDFKTRILVVDDMSTMRKLVIKALKEIGFTDIVEATDGALGWEALSSAGGQIGLVVSDWNMPNCSGLDFLKRVRSDGRFKSLPFVLLTAESDKAQVVEALTAGVSSYIIKPFTAEMLIQKLEQAQPK